MTPSGGLERRQRRPPHLCGIEASGRGRWEVERLPTSSQMGTRPKELVERLTDMSGPTRERRWQQLHIVAGGRVRWEEVAAHKHEAAAARPKPKPKPRPKRKAPGPDDLRRSGRVASLPEQPNYVEGAELRDSMYDAYAASSKAPTGEEKAGAVAKAEELRRRIHHIRRPAFVKTVNHICASRAKPMVYIFRASPDYERDETSDDYEDED